AGGAREPRGAEHAAEELRRGPSVADVERGEGHPGRPQLVRHLAPGAQRVDVHAEPARVEVAHHLLEMALGTARVEQRGEVGDARHARAGRASRPQRIGPATATAGSDKDSTWRRMVTI